MPNYLSPGVYVEEVSSGNKPIAGVGTSTGAFVGIAEKGVIGQAKLITNWSQFVREFGGFTAQGYLAYAVFGFFAEGGTSCYVVRTCHYSNKIKTAVASAVSLKDNEDKECLRVTATSEGVWGDNIKVEIKPASKSEGFKLTVYYGATATKENIVEVFDRLTMKTVEDAINLQSRFIRVEKDAWKDGSTSVTGSGNPPKTKSGTDEFYLEPLSGGNDGLAGIAYTDYIGDESAQYGLHAFDIIDDINLVSIPDAAGDSTISAQVINEALIYCKNRKDCFMIADAPLKGHTVEDVPIEEDAMGVKKFIADNKLSSSYAAFYYPWVYVSDPLSTKDKKRLVPPSGVVAGTYAYTDSTRGVHKAPAGIGEGYLDSVLGVMTTVTKGEQGKLNEAGINVIRVLPEGLCIWGARTMTKDREWNYINVRRLFLYLEESIDEGTQWVVFEPNDPNLWGKVQRNLTAFLTRVWRSGALFGSSPEEAFFVKVDAENNPPEVRDAGQLIIEVGVAPVKPAEFVMIRVSQKTLMK